MAKTKLSHSRDTRPCNAAVRTQVIARKWPNKKPFNRRLHSSTPRSRWQRRAVARHSKMPHAFCNIKTPCAAHDPFAISKHLAQRTTHLQYQSTLRSVEGYLSVYVYLTHTTYMPQYSSHLAQPHDPFAAKFVGIVLNQTSVHACIDVGHVHEAADKYIGARAYTHARAHTERKRQLKVRTAQRRRKEERDTVGQIAAREAPFQCPHTGTAGKGLTSHIGRIPSRKI